MPRRPVNRINPALPAAAMKTYSATPYWRDADCEEVGCENYERGWITLVDEGTDLGQRQAAYIRAECRPEGAALSPAASGVRRYRESRGPDVLIVTRHHEDGTQTDEPFMTPEGATAFVFGPGQQCFAQHRVQADRQELFVVRGGDWRGNPTGSRREHARPEHWVEDMQETLDGLQTFAERG